ncbi:MAG: hypothetical protein P8K76_14660 [Candidatus Binatia bacterium]|nr:hypothetical protein [Candidatus Binatia bacterium]MDG1956990.1 hypothetical protein [Candidatus Binatia bacterium]MDG2011011.1 hypothetical protein [Candidatus Binatia bacterium]HAC81290.1 hypothetical protein [Deltaproteobacteria bacterium]
MNDAKKSSRGLLLSTLFFLAFSLSGCGDSDICLGCDPSSTPTPNPENSVDVIGDIFSAIPSTLYSELRVLVCTNRPSSTPPLDCGGRNTEPDDNGDFALTKVSPGALEVFIYLRFDTAQLATLQDPGDKLSNITRGETVDVQSITVNLTTGVADASYIEIGPTATPTPTPGL